MLITLKKYKNRKIYNAATKQHVNLPEIASLLQQGNDITIIDYTGQDVTLPVLVNTLALVYPIAPLATPVITKIDELRYKV